MSDSNPDLDRLCIAAQRAAAEGKDLRDIIRAVLEEMKNNSDRVSQCMIAGMSGVREVELQDIPFVSMGFFGILAAYRGTVEDDD